MSGTIGVTAAAKLLDIYLTENAPPYRAKLVRLLAKVNIKCKAIRAAQMSDPVKEHLLDLVRNHYIDRLVYDLKGLMCEFPYTMSKQYINTVTRLHFTPETVTQKRLAARTAAAAAAGLASNA